MKFNSESIILSDHHFWGGFRASLDLARFCAVFNRGMSMHSNSHLGISLAAMAHLAAAVPNLTYDCDTHYPWQDEHDLLVQPLQFEEGAVAYQSCRAWASRLIATSRRRCIRYTWLAGLTERNDEVEMQKVNPAGNSKPRAGKALGGHVDFDLRQRKGLPRSHRITSFLLA